MDDLAPDLWGVWRDLDRIRRNAARSRFRACFDELADGEGMPSFGGEPTPAQAAQTKAQHAQRMACAFLLSGDGAFADWAIHSLDALAANPVPWHIIQHSDMYPQDTADLITAENTKACANAVSWLRHRLTPDQRERYTAMIAERGGQPIYAGAMAGCWWGNALNSNWTAVLNSGLAFAALISNQEDWLAFARARTLEMLDLAAEEAAGVEGAGYWLYCFASLQDIVEGIRNVTGEDLYAHPFWDQASRFMPYLALPDMSAWVNFADTGYAGLGGSHFFHGVAARKRDGFAQWFGNELLRRHPGASWRSLIYYDPDVPEQGPAAEPPCRVFKSIHLASFRSGWDDDATFMLFKGGSNAWSHTHLDLNSFFITSHGERLATEPGPEHYSLAYWHSIQPVVSTAHHNCIVVDGAHQRVPAQYAMSYDLEEAGDCYSRLSDHVSEPWVEMIRGDATTAYGDQLSRAWRDVVYLKPNVFVIFDDLIGHPVRTQRNFEWMLHSECELHELDGRLEARGEKATLRIEPIFPLDWEYKFIAGRTIPYADHKPLHAVSLRPYWHHKWNVNPRKSPYPHWDAWGDVTPLFDNTCQFLVVLTALPVGGDVPDPPPCALEPIAQGTAKGVRLVGEGEETIVVFNHNREMLALGDLRTDAEKIVRRTTPDGKCLAQSLIGGDVT